MLTQTQVISGIAETMFTAGYTAVESLAPKYLTQVFEDAYGVVATAFFSDWPELHASWPDAQGELVEILSQVLDRTEPKAWEGYLVLVVAAPVLADEARAVAALRKDITRLRKLVIVGDELETLSDLHRALLPVLPLDASGTGKSSTGFMDALPTLLADSSSIPISTTAALIAAFLENEPLMEAIDQELHRR
ncbi:MAG: hypothetical protein KDB26_15965 [Microthrixaceae bacterium]|nr:hypothetical protein [Microthrixaceae bacterium]